MEPVTKGTNSGRKKYYSAKQGRGGGGGGGGAGGCERSTRRQTQKGGELYRERPNKVSPSPRSVGRDRYQGEDLKVASSACNGARNRKTSKCTGGPYMEQHLTVSNLSGVEVLE